MQSILIKDTTREERIRIVNQSADRPVNSAMAVTIWAAVWWTAISSRISTEKKKFQNETPRITAVW